jgi:hypothetical protein
MLTTKDLLKKNTGDSVFIKDGDSFIEAKIYRGTDIANNMIPPALFPGETELLFLCTNSDKFNGITAKDKQGMLYSWCVVPDFNITWVESNEESQKLLKEQEEKKKKLFFTLEEADTIRLDERTATVATGSITERWEVQEAEEENSDEDDDERPQRCCPECSSSSFIATFKEEASRDSRKTVEFDEDGGSLVDWEDDDFKCYDTQFHEVRCSSCGMLITYADIIDSVRGA